MQLSIVFPLRIEPSATDILAERALRMYRLCLSLNGCQLIVCVARIYIKTPPAYKHINIPAIPKTTVMLKHNPINALFISSALIMLIIETTTRASNKTARIIANIINIFIHSTYTRNFDTRLRFRFRISDKSFNICPLYFLPLNRSNQ